MTLTIFLSPFREYEPLLLLKLQQVPYDRKSAWSRREFPSWTIEVSHCKVCGDANGRDEGQRLVALKQFDHVKHDGSQRSEGILVSLSKWLYGHCLQISADALMR